MKLEIDKFKVNTKPENSEEQTRKQSGWVNLIIMLAITLAITIAIGISVAVRVNIDYQWTNRPQADSTGK